MDQRNDIRVQCPNKQCGAILRLPMRDDIETKIIVCPKCKTRAPFTQYRKHTPQATPPPLPPNPLTPPPLPPEIKPTPSGHLEEVLTKHVHTLTEGDNIIGRMASTSGARIKLPSPGNRMSREHLIIKVIPVGMSFRYTAELAKQQVNPTAINGVNMTYGNAVELRNGDLIALPGLQLRFKINNI